MSVISSDQYGELLDFSGNSQQRQKTFHSVFICGKKRRDQTVGMMYSVNPGVSLDATIPANEKYLINGESEVNVIWMFLKKVRSKNEKVAGKEKLTYFDWNPDVKKDYPKDAKISWIFAGALLDNNLKPVMDPEYPDRVAFVYFRNSGAKCGAAVDFVNSLAEKSKELQPLSDKPGSAFEIQVITPRRFITKVTVDYYTHPEHGDQAIFKYELFKKLPDEMVIQFMDKAKKYVDPFKLQFDLSNLTSSEDQEVDTNQAAAPSFEDDSAAQKIEESIAGDLTLPKL